MTADDDRRRRNWIPRLADRVQRLIEMAGEGGRPVTII